MALVRIHKNSSGERWTGRLQCQQQIFESIHLGELYITLLYYQGRYSYIMHHFEGDFCCDISLTYPNPTKSPNSNLVMAPNLNLLPRSHPGWGVSRSKLYTTETKGHGCHGMLTRLLNSCFVVFCVGTLGTSASTGARAAIFARRTSFRRETHSSNEKTWLFRTTQEIYV